MTINNFLSYCDVCGNKLSEGDYFEMAVCKKCVHDSGEVRVVDADAIEKEWPDRNEE